MIRCIYFLWGSLQISFDESQSAGGSRHPGVVSMRSHSVTALRYSHALSALGGLRLRSVRPFLSLSPIIEVEHHPTVSWHALEHVSTRALVARSSPFKHTGFAGFVIWAFHAFPAAFASWKWTSWRWEVNRWPCVQKNCFPVLFFFGWKLVRWNRFPVFSVCQSTSNPLDGLGNFILFICFGVWSIWMC